MEILAAILGGFLAAGTGWFLQTRLENARLKRLRTLLLVGMRDDLNNAIELFGRLSDDWDKGKVVWFATINEFAESREVYVKNKDWITLLHNDDLRVKILRYYRRSANHILQLQNSQQRKYDIQYKYDALVVDLRRQNPTMPIDQVNDTAFQLMNVETQELKFVNEQLPKLIQQLDRFKIDAQEILKEIGPLAARSW
jgi:hypothetical protein